MEARKARGRVRRRGGARLLLLVHQLGEIDRRGGGHRGGGDDLLLHLELDLLLDLLDLLILRDLRRLPAAAT